MLWLSASVAVAVAANVSIFSAVNVILKLSSVSVGLLLYSHVLQTITARVFQNCRLARSFRLDSKGTSCLSLLRFAGSSGSMEMLL